MLFDIQLFGGGGASLGGMGLRSNYGRDFKSNLSYTKELKKIASLGNAQEINRYLRGLEENSHNTFSARMNTIENTRDKRKDIIRDAYNKGNLNNQQRDRLLKRERQIYAKARDRIDAINRKELAIIKRLNRD